MIVVPNQQGRTLKRSSEKAAPFKPIVRSHSDSQAMQDQGSETCASTPTFKLAPLASYVAHLKQKSPDKKKCDLIPMQTPQPLRFRTDPRFLRRGNRLRLFPS